ncbi:hypothetical protein [Mucilaginibacter sp. SP1R1]|nr:hypothetical protein [Mucilaginibacter sp. SP1R1]MBB6151145.1 hypothetical protein [Mucilaginibacter sp. SP1R1]
MKSKLKSLRKVALTGMVVSAIVLFNSCKKESLDTVKKDSTGQTNPPCN